MFAASQPITPFTEPLDAVASVPGSKSHTNRVLACAGLAAGRSEISGVLFADDTEAMMGVLRTIGVSITADPSTRRVSVDGVGGRVRPGPLALDFRQSGTTARFAATIVGLGSGRYRLDGDPQLRERPMGPVVEVLESLGATADGHRLPFTVETSGLRPGTVRLAGSTSSQFLSGLLLAAPYARPQAGTSDGGKTSEGSSIQIEIVDELVSKPYVDLTIATMAAFGVEVENHGYRRFVVPAGQYSASTITVEPDASAASYFFAAAAIVGGRVRVEGLGHQSLQGDVAFVDVLEQMGAVVHKGPDWVEVEGTGQLRGVNVDMSAISDTAQTLAVVASYADSPTTVTGIDFIRHKETDRVAAVVTELNKRHIKATEDPDGFTIYPGEPTPGVVDTYDDHRMAMSFSLLGLRHHGIVIDNPQCVTKTFPQFFTALESLRA